MKLIDWQTAQRHHFFSEIRRHVLAPDGNQPPHSPKPVVGPVVNALRKLVWRVAGFRYVLQQRNHELIQLLSDLESTRPMTGYQTPDATFYFRQGTGDWPIFYEVFLNNEYRLPEALGAEDVVIDIGMHIGSFSFAALSRGAGRVYAFEVDKGNFELAAHNLRVFGARAQLSRKAVWRSDRKGDELFAFKEYIRDRQTENTGGGCILWTKNGEKLETVALDDVIHEATDHGRKRVKFMKVDCEGSEFPILLTSRKLHLVDTICGEYHEIADDNVHMERLPDTARVEGVKSYDRHTVAACLTRAGFKVALEPKDGCNLGLFFATRE
jgi:FkbM family methyltransferase